MVPGDSVRRRANMQQRVCARVTVVQHLEIESLEFLERIPVGRHQFFPGDGALGTRLRGSPGLRGAGPTARD